MIISSSVVVTSVAHIWLSAGPLTWEGSMTRLRMEGTTTRCLVGTDHCVQKATRSCYEVSLFCPSKIAKRAEERAGPNQTQRTKAVLDGFAFSLTSLSTATPAITPPSRT
jgi:hypothetical protein